MDSANISEIEVLRATEEWQRAGAYAVRVQGMNRQYHISLREEFDGHDCDGTRYIVLLDDGYDVAQVFLTTSKRDLDEAYRLTVRSLGVKEEKIVVNEVFT